MSARNAELIRRGYDAFSRGDLAAVFRVLGEEISWHVPGRSPLSGDFSGHEQVGQFFASTMALSGGTFRIDIQDIVDHGDQVIVLCTVAAERNGQAWSSPEVHVWRVDGDRAVAFREFQGDQQTEDEFWNTPPPA